MHKDFLEDILEVGDVVIVVNHNKTSTEICTGMVTGFTKQRVRIIKESWGSNCREQLKSSEYLIKHPKIPKQDLSDIHEDCYLDYFKEVVCNK